MHEQESISFTLLYKAGEYFKSLRYQVFE